MTSSELRQPEGRMTLVEVVTKRLTLHGLGEEELPEQFLLRLRDHQAMGWELVGLSWEHGEPSVVMQRSSRFCYGSSVNLETLER